MGLDKRPERSSKLKANERFKQSNSDSEDSLLPSDPGKSYDYNPNSISLPTRKRRRSQRPSKIVSSSDDQLSPDRHYHARLIPPELRLTSDSEGEASYGVPGKASKSTGVVTKFGRVSKPTKMISPCITPTRTGRSSHPPESLTREERLERRRRLSDTMDPYDTSIAQKEVPMRTRRGTPRPHRATLKHSSDGEQMPDGKEPLERDQDGIEHQLLDSGNAMQQDNPNSLTAPTENGSTKTKNHLIKQSELEARNGVRRRSRRIQSNEFDSSDPPAQYDANQPANGARQTRRKSRLRVSAKNSDEDDGDDDYHTPGSDDISDDPEEPLFEESELPNQASDSDDFIDTPVTRRPKAARNRKAQPHRTVTNRSSRKKRRVDPEQSTIARTTRQSYRPRSVPLRPSDFYPDVESSTNSFSSRGNLPAPSRPRPTRAAASRAGDAIATDLAPTDYLEAPMTTMDTGMAGRGRHTSRYSKRRSQMRPSHHDAFATDGDEAPGLNTVGIEPIQVDLSLTWDDIGGLDHHVQSLKEMVALPLLYPEVFEKFNMEAPKGVLFYGPPGTGKTLCARALAASCGSEPTPEVAEFPAQPIPVNQVASTSAQEVIDKVTQHSAPVEQNAKTSDEIVGGNDVVMHEGSAAPETNDTAAPKQADEKAAEKSAVKIPLRLKIEAGMLRRTEPINNTTVSDDKRASGITAPPTPSPLCTLQNIGVLPTTPTLATAGTHPVVVPAKPVVKEKPRVSFFMRNGADCLSKWVGEAERQLRMTFEAAKKHQPSIIFFDEIDGLAPVRSSRQDQIHSSIVSTLLGLMDGLDARGKVVVIGATNRVDAIDPALRRPGRFDRELIFTLPNMRARRKILGIHTSKWRPPPSDDVLDAVSKLTVGYCGADLKSLCSEAAIRALRRRYPQIYESQDKLLIDVDQVRVSTRDFLAAMKEIVPASHRSARTHARPIPDRLRAILNVPLRSCLEVLRRIFAPGFSAEALSDMDQTSNTRDSDDNIDSGSDLVCSSDEEDHAVNIENMQSKMSNAGKLRSVFGSSSHGLHHTLRPRLLICGIQGLGQAQLGPALLHFFEGCPVHAIDYPSLYADAGARSAEEALVSAFREAARSVPSILYLPHLQLWWESAPESLRTTLIIALKDIPADLPLLVLAMAEEALNALPSAVTELFGELHELSAPKEHQRREMFAPLVEAATARPKLSHAAAKRRRQERKTEVLPKAPPPAAKPITAEDNARKAQTEDRFIRILRMEMREFVEKLLRDRRFKAFWNAVDPISAPDYYDIIKIPMDISKIASQIDMGRYPTVLAMVNDFDIMVRNAIQYNPPNTETGAAILRRAHGLIDIVHAWVDNLNPSLIETCNKIIGERLARAQQADEKNGEGEGDGNRVAKSEDWKASEETANVSVGEAGAGAGAEVKARSDEKKSGESRQEAMTNHVEEETLIPASHNQLVLLRKLMLDVSSGVTVDGLEALYMRCGAELHRQRRSMNRSAVVKSLMDVIAMAREDPAVVGTLVE